jgi:ABC-type polysaccharide/polyol phosphate export permease
MKLARASLIDGCDDFVLTLRSIHVAVTLGWQDVVSRYRRSSIGAFWITTHMGLMIAALSYVFGSVFSQKMDLFLPYLSIGLIVWGFVASSINDGCNAFTSSQGIILNVQMPFVTHVVRALWRNVIIFMHNFLIVPIVLFVSSRSITTDAAWFILGIFVVLVNLGWMMLVLAIFCSRYRDMGQIVQSLMQIVFYFTPIIWTVDQMSSRATVWILGVSPFFHFVSVVRSPLLGVSPSSSSWWYLAIMSLVGWFAALSMLGICRRKIAYWL